MSTPQTIKLLYSRREAAWALGVSLRSLDYLIENQQLRSRTLGKRRLVPSTELTRFASADRCHLTAIPE